MGQSMTVPHDASQSPQAGPALQKPDMASLRRMMVDCQLRTYDVTDKAVLAAMDTVSREAFVPPSQAELAYLDRPVTVGNDAGHSPRALMTPMVLARMLQALALKPGETALDYAGATGYSAAVMAAMGAVVTAVETDAGMLALARSALAAVPSDGDKNPVTTLAALRPEDRGFDAVLVNGGCEVVPDALLHLLAPDGRLVCVIGEGRAASVMLYQRSGDAMGGRKIFDASVPMLAEFRKPAAFVF